jgi:hypothetical protein
MDAGDVLKELQGLGALGKRRSGREIEEPKTPSGVWDLDPRIPPTKESLQEVAARWAELRRAQEAFETALQKVFDIWEGESQPVVDQEPPDAAAERSEAAPKRIRPVRKVQKVEASPEELERVRAAARRKILGEDLSEVERGRLAASEEEEAIPFVGQVRARVEGVAVGETTVGTLGTIKASFPKEEEDA